MNKSELIKLKSAISVNKITVTHIVIGRHYLEKHSSYMTDDLILLLIQSLDGKTFESDSSSRGIEYFVADIEFKPNESKVKIYRLIWLFEGKYLEILGVINSYRINKKRNK